MPVVKGEPWSRLTSGVIPVTRAGARLGRLGTIGVVRISKQLLGVGCIRPALALLCKSLRIGIRPVKEILGKWSGTVTGEASNNPPLNSPQSVTALAKPSGMSVGLEGSKIGRDPRSAS